MTKVSIRTCAAGAEAVAPAGLKSALALPKRERGRVHAAGTAPTISGVSRGALVCSMSGSTACTGVAATTRCCAASPEWFCPMMPFAALGGLVGEDVLGLRTPRCPHCLLSTSALVVTFHTVGRCSATASNLHDEEHQ